MSRIIIFANGNLTQPDRLRALLRPTDRIFCADGGTRHALTLGLTPDVIIGDLDSLPPDIAAQMETAGVDIRRYPVRKDETDLELALRAALAENPTEIVLLTALGGRLDQMLANILLLTRPEYAAVSLSLFDGDCQAMLLRSHQAISLTGQPGDTLSLIPLTPMVNRVTLTGVEWPLDRATLSMGSTLTVSNAFAEPMVSVQIGEGLVLVVHFDKEQSSR